MGTKDPTSSLRHIIQFIMSVYVPMWFTIKTNATIEHGAKNLFNTVERTRHLSEECQKIIFPVIQRNGYFGHPENMLLTMICDENKCVRQLGWRKILKARILAQDRRSTNFRKFIIPTFNFQADKYYDLINWNTIELREPPGTFDIDDNQIKNLIDTGDKFKSELTKIPCHTQGVERSIKLVTKASVKVCGQRNRAAFIKCTLQFRYQMKSFETKNQFE